jgi:hypothetical protein
VLTALFSYVNTLTLPWRLAVLWHMCGHRSDEPGRDFYGRHTEAIWFHIPRRPRAAIISLLLSSSVAHVATQASRFVYHSYDLSGHRPPANMPGAIVTSTRRPILIPSHSLSESATCLTRFTTRNTGARCTPGWNSEEVSLLPSKTPTLPPRPLAPGAQMSHLPCQ